MTQLITIDNRELNLDKKNETLWATQKQIAEIFDVEVPAISKHISNILNDGELHISVISKMETTASDGKKYNVEHYNLDMIIAIGYRVNSKKATDFRKKATKILKEYLTTGEVKKSLPPINSNFLLQIAEEMRKNELLIAEQKNTIEAQDNSICAISNTQDSYSLREAKNRLICGEMQLKNFLLDRKWVQYLSDGVEGKKLYSTAYSANRGFVVDKAVLNKARQSFFQQCRITNKGMDFLIKQREAILTF